MKLNVYIRVQHEKIVCLCLAKRKGCGRKCERGVVDYDQFRDLNYVMKHNTEVHIK